MAASYERQAVKGDAMITWKETEPDKHVTQLGKLRLVVCLMDKYGPDVWVAWTLPGAVAEEPLIAKELDAAKREAVQLVKVFCAGVLKGLE